MQFFIVPTSSPCFPVAQEIARASFSWLLIEPGHSHSNALIFPSKRLGEANQSRLREIGAIEAEGLEIELRPELKDMSQEIAELTEIKRAGEFLCIRSFTRLVGNQYRIEAYTARSGNTDAN